MYPPAEATTPNRHRERMRYDAETVHAVLDAAFLAHVSFTLEGRPQVLPLMFGRDGSSVYVHTSTGSHLALAVRRAGVDGLPVAFAVTHADRLVLSRSAMHHSMDYRCVVAHGPLRMVTGEAEELHGYRVLLDHMIPGRSADCREPNARERAQTALMRLELREVAAKARAHGLSEDEADLGLPHWAGTVPLVPALGVPLADAGQETPGYLARWAAARPSAAGDAG